MLCQQENLGAAVVAYPVFGLPDLLSSIKRQKFISIIVVRTGVHVIRGFKHHNLLQKDKYRAWLSWVLMILYASQVGLCAVRVIWSLQ